MTTTPTTPDQPEALRIIAEWPITDPGNMDAANMAKIARDALNAAAHDPHIRIGDLMRIYDEQKGDWCSIAREVERRTITAMRAAAPAAPAWADQAVVEYQYTGGTHWCPLGPAERMRTNFDGVYRLQAGHFPVAATTPQAKPSMAQRAELQSLLHCLRNALEIDQRERGAPNGGGWAHWIGKIEEAQEELSQAASRAQQLGTAQDDKRCQACIDRHDSVFGSYAPECPIHDDDGNLRARGDAPQAQQPGAAEVTDGTRTLQQDVISAILDYASSRPEDDETWESWFEAAFDLAQSRVRQVFDEHAAPAAVSAPAQEPVGEAGTMPGTSGFTMACFHADKVPVGAKLYAAPQAGAPEGWKPVPVEPTMEMLNAGDAHREVWTRSSPVHVGRRIAANIYRAMLAAAPQAPAPAANADAQDAARYRWLRSRDLDVIQQGGVFAGKTPDNVVLNGADLDTAIDTARAQAQGEPTDAR